MKGGGTGDPHFTTLDNVKYLFNGYGEFVLFEIDDIKFKCQIRIQSLLDKEGGTVFKAIALEHLNSDRVQVELNEVNDVVVYLNGRPFELTSDWSRTKSTFSFKRVALLLDNRDMTIFFLNGITISLTLNSDMTAFSLLTTVPNQFRQKTKGLLGNMNGNPLDDFILPDGSTIKIDPDNDRDIYYKFGSLWQTTNQTSIFTYSYGQNWSSFVRPAYAPTFVIDNGITFANKTLESLAKTKCGSNKDCLFDVMITGDLSIGDMSIQFDKELKNELAQIDLVVDACASCQVSSASSSSQFALLRIHYGLLSFFFIAFTPL